jgi:protein-arginine deiminase
MSRKSNFFVLSVLLLNLPFMHQSIWGCPTYDPPNVYISDWVRYVAVYEDAEFEAYDSEHTGIVDWDWTYPSNVTLYDQDDTSTTSIATFYANTAGVYTVYAEGTNGGGLSDDDYARIYCVDISIDNDPPSRDTDELLEYENSQGAEIFYTLLPNQSMGRYYLYLKIRDAVNTLIRTEDLGYEYQGDCDTSWDGKNDANDWAPPGVYTAEIEFRKAYPNQQVASDSYVLMVGSFASDPADTYSGATSLPVGSIVYEQIDSSDEDWYEITSDNSGLVDISLVFLYGTDLDWQVSADTGSGPDLNNPVAEGSSGSSPAIGTLVFDTNTTYYLKIEPNGSSTGIYALNIEMDVVVDIDVDSDRDGIIDEDDEDLEETQAAIVPVNIDDDDQFPDCDFVNNCIDNQSDLNDLVALRIHALPSGWTAQLRISSGDVDELHVFNGNDPFNPSSDTYWVPGSQSSDHSYPILGNQYNLNGGVVSSQNTYAIPDISSDLTYYMEAHEFRSTSTDNFEIELEATNGSVVITDRVLLRPSPFLLIPATHSPIEIYVADHLNDPDDDPFVTELKAAVTASVTDVDSDDFWFQDEFEVGHTSWPGGGMHVMMNLPRDRGLNEWVQDQLGPDMGHFHGGAGEGGDIEVIPSGSHGIVVTGSSSSGIEDFIVAQGVQSRPGQNSIVVCDTSWLFVKHIDEVVSLGSSCSIASCTKALNILDDLNMSSTGIASTGSSNTVTSNGILQHDGVDLNPQEWIGGFITITSGSGIGQVRQIAGITHNDGLDTSTITVSREWDSVALPASGSGLELASRSAYRVMFGGGQEECGVATSASSNTLVNTARSQPWNGEYDSQNPIYSYVMIVSGPGEGESRRIVSSQNYTITIDQAWNVIPAEESIYVLAETPKTDGFYWGETEAQDGYMYSIPQHTVVKYFLENNRVQQENYQDSIDSIESTLAPYVGGFTEVPSIYRTVGNSAVAWMPAMVNCLVVGNRVIAEPFVSPNASINNMFKSLGGTYVDDWYFLHTGYGEVHCGTNVKREPGGLVSWW